MELPISYGERERRGKCYGRQSGDSLEATHSRETSSLCLFDYDHLQSADPLNFWLTVVPAERFPVLLLLNGEHFCLWLVRVVAQPALKATK